MSMRPLPETEEADNLYGPFLSEDVDLLERLVALSGQVSLLIPTCIGISLSLHREGITLTVVAPTPEAALHDALGFLMGAGSQNGAPPDKVIEAEQDQPGERWPWFAETAAREGARSTLSLPVLRAGDPVAGFTLYASSPGAFDGRHDRLAEILGAQADQALVDADLAFTSKVRAREATARLRSQARLTVAAGAIARRRSLSHDQAEQMLRTAAARGAARLEDVVDRVIEVFGD